MKIKNKLLKILAFCAAVILLAIAYQTIASLTTDPIGQFIFKIKAGSYVKAAHKDADYQLVKIQQNAGLWQFDFYFSGNNSQDKNFWLTYNNGKLIDDSYERMVTDLKNIQKRLSYEVTQDVLNVLISENADFSGISNAAADNYSVDWKKENAGYIYVLYGSELPNSDTMANPSAFKDKIYIDMPYNRGNIDVPLEISLTMNTKSANAKTAAALLRQIDALLKKNDIYISRYGIYLYAIETNESFNCNRINEELINAENFEQILEQKGVKK